MCHWGDWLLLLFTRDMETVEEGQLGVLGSRQDNASAGCLPTQQETERGTRFCLSRKVMYRSVVYFRRSRLFLCVTHVEPCKDRCKWVAEKASCIIEIFVCISESIFKTVPLLSFFLFLTFLVNKCYYMALEYFILFGQSGRNMFHVPFGGFSYLWEGPNQFFGLGAGSQM